MHQRAVEAALVPLRELIGEAPGAVPEATIPVDAEDWPRCLRDAAVAQIPRDVARLTREICELNPAQATYPDIRTMATTAAAQLRPVLMNVASLAAFVPAAHVARELLETTCGTVQSACDALIADSAEPGPDPAEVQKSLSVLVARLSSARGTSADVWDAAFGIPTTALSFDSSAVLSSQLMAAFHGRYDKLESRLGTLLGAISSVRLELIKEIELACSILASPMPLITLRTARAVRGLVIRRYDEEPLVTSDILVKFLFGVGSSFENQRGAGRIRELLAQAESPRERAAYELDLYRRMTEGQVRPWAGIIARFLGAHSGNRVPEIGPLKAMLEATGDWLAADIASRLRPEFRNAAAHEDYGWDRNLARIVFDGGTVSEDELRLETEAGYSFMCGAEIGWAFVRTERDGLGKALDVDPGPARRAILDSRRAAAHFGSNGIRLNSFDFNGDDLIVTISELTPSTVNPCVQAMMWVSEFMPVLDAVAVRTPAHEDPALLIKRSAFALTFPLWLSARRWFEQMPPSVFVPALTDNRLRAESSETAAQAALWEALNAALMAYDEFDRDTAGIRLPTAIRQRLVGLSRALALAAGSLVAAGQVLPDQEQRLLGRPYKFVNAAAIWARSGSAGDDVGPLARLRDRIATALEAIDTPLLLPTLWPDKRIE